MDRLVGVASSVTRLALTAAISRASSAAKFASPLYLRPSNPSRDLKTENRTRSSHPLKVPPMKIARLLTFALLFVVPAWLSAADNTPPEGFTALFNGKDLTGWKGLPMKPHPKDASKSVPMSMPERLSSTGPQMAAAQKAGDASMNEHWKVVDGVIVFDGKGQSLCTAKEYGDVEFFVDWKIEAKGDSGIYVRGSPQIQIWDPALRNIGSGGLFNNQKNPANPLKTADKPIGEWNTFKVRMVGDKVSVWLNGELVTDNVTLENYWDRTKPIYSAGTIELQNHGNTLYFKNIYVKELTSEPAPAVKAPGEGFTSLFNGKDLTGWIGNQQGYAVENESIVCVPGGKGGGGNLYTEKQYKDFHFAFDFRLPSGANNGIGLRAPTMGDAAYVGMECQVLDDYAPGYWNKLAPYQYHGSIYGVSAVTRGFLRPAGHWNHEEIIVKGNQVTVILNGVTVNDVDIAKASDPETIDKKSHPGLKNDKGHIGFLGHGSKVEFRSLWIKELP